MVSAAPVQVPPSDRCGEHPTAPIPRSYTRCRLNGATDWKPTGWLLSGNRLGALRRWPDADVPLIRFERCKPSHGPSSGVRVPADAGPALAIPHWQRRHRPRHIASWTIRPANDYIVVTEGDMPQRRTRNDSLHLGLRRRPRLPPLRAKSGFG